MKPGNIFLAALLSTACLSASAQNLDSILTTKTALLYQGHVITKSTKPGADTWTITIKKNGKVLKEFEIGDTMSKEWAKLGLFNFLGGAKKQLIVFGYSGGAHCCWEYRVIDFSPTFRVVYDSREWKVGYGLALTDLNRDGIFELNQKVMTFDYFPFAHAGSPFPPAVFKYDPGAGRYLPANRLFPSQITKGIRTSLAQINELKKKSWKKEESSVEKSQYVSVTLDVFLRYLYSGQEKRAWEFFENYYTLDDKQEIMLGIRQKLQSCAVYNHLYAQGN